MTKLEEIKKPHNPFLSGNFAPVDEELSAPCDDIIGEVPAELEGAFLRIGPNPLFVPDIEKYHWFDGDGMIHEVSFGGGKAAYRNRFVETKGLQLEREKGDWIWRGLSSPPDMSNEHGPFKNAANTAMVFHADKLLALWEGGNPHHVGLPGLETVGETDFGGKLKHPFTAHPKVDPVTGEMIAFGYSGIAPPYLHYTVVDKDGAISHDVAIDLPKGVMMHDFAITEHYTLFLDFPVTFDLQELMAGGPPLKWDPDNGARIGVIPRHGAPSEIRWFDVETCFAFHTANAYEEGDEVVLDACRSKKTNVVGADTSVETDPDDLPFLYQWRLNLKTGAVSEVPVDPEHGSEFPRINEAFMGRKNRYTYAARIARAGGGSFDGVIKYDRAEDTMDAHLFGPGRYGGEAVFAPRPNGQAEDDGWVICFVWDEDAGESECQVIDARDFAAGPVATIKLPGRVPFGFHATWVDSDAIAGQNGL